jgi:SnoaL-like domain
MEHGMEQDDEAVIEWTMTWRDPKSGEKRLNRGTEWFRLRDGKIAEVRAYHHGDRKNPRGDLLGFDFRARGYTTLDDDGPDG